MQRLGQNLAWAGLLLIGSVLGLETSPGWAQEVIVPHSRSAVYTFGPSSYMPPQVSASPAVGVSSPAYPAYGSLAPFGMPYGGWGWGGGMYRPMPWGLRYGAGQGPFGLVPRSL